MKPNEFKIPRRNFLAASAFLAAPLVLPGRVLGRDGAVPPNEQLTLAVIGTGNRGKEIAGDLYSDGRCFRILAVCDCYRKHLEMGKESVDRFTGNSDCRAYARYEDVLERGDIDAVGVATPDHWHTKITIDAFKKGKDVYCEKPLTLTPMESRQIVAAARKYNRVCCGGSQRVMDDYGYIAPIIRGGRIGEVKEVHIAVGGPPEHFVRDEEPIPDGFDWDRWLGQAPWRPFNWDLCNGGYGGGWRRVYDYGNGFLADWGGHRLAAALYILGIDHLEPLAVIPPKCEGNDREFLVWVYPGDIRIYHIGPHREDNHELHFFGSEGEFRHDADKRRLSPLRPVEVRRYANGLRRMPEDFEFCVRNRLRPFQDVEYAAKAALACQLGNIAYHLNRPLKWNAEKTEFLDDPQANRFVSRYQREPYTISID